MDLSQFFNNQSLLNLFFKAFVYVFAVVYFLFAIVIYRQTQVMNKSLTTGRTSLINLISLIQIFVALVIIILVFSLV